MTIHRAKDIPLIRQLAPPTHGGTAKIINSGHASKRVRLCNFNESSNEKARDEQIEKLHDETILSQLLRNGRSIARSSRDGSIT